MVVQSQTGDRKAQLVREVHIGALQLGASSGDDDRFDLSAVLPVARLRLEVVQGSPNFANQIVQVGLDHPQGRVLSGAIGIDQFGEVQLRLTLFRVLR